MSAAAGSSGVAVLPGGATVKDWSKNAKLIKFFKSENPPVKRLKSITSFYADVFADAKDFHTQHYSTVYKVILDCLHHFDFVGKTEAVPIDDIFEVLTVLSRLLPDIQTHLQKRWQARSIGNLIQSLVMYGNRFELRARGLELLLLFMDILHVQCDQSITAILSDVINFGPLCDGTNSPPKLRQWFETRPLTGKSLFSFGHATKPQTKEESLKLLSSMLAFCSAPVRRPRFGFWMDMLKSKVLVQLYPGAFPNGVPAPPTATSASERAAAATAAAGKDAKTDAAASSSGGISSGGKDSASPTAASAAAAKADAAAAKAEEEKDKESLRAYAFRPECPPGAQVVVAEWLVASMYDVELALVLGGTQPNVDFMMEAFRQTFYLPIAYGATVTQVIRLYRAWTRGTFWTNFMRFDTQVVFRTMLDHAFAAFRLIANSDPEQVATLPPVLTPAPAQDAKVLPAKLTLCAEIVTLYSQLSGEGWQLLHDDTWQHLLQTLMNVISYLIRSGEYHNASIWRELITPALDCLFECYLRTATDERTGGGGTTGNALSGAALWEVLRTRIAQWSHCKPALDLWSKKLQSLTQNLLHVMSISAQSLPVRPIQSVQQTTTPDNAPTGKTAPTATATPPVSAALIAATAAPTPPPKPGAPPLPPQPPTKVLPPVPGGGALPAPPSTPRSTAAAAAKMASSLSPQQNFLLKKQRQSLFIAAPTGRSGSDAAFSSLLVAPPSYASLQTDLLTSSTLLAPHPLLVPTTSGTPGPNAGAGAKNTSSILSGVVAGAAAPTNATAAPPTGPAPTNTPKKPLPPPPIAARKPLPKPPGAGDASEPDTPTSPGAGGRKPAPRPPPRAGTVDTLKELAAKDAASTTNHIPLLKIYQSATGSAGASTSGSSPASPVAGTAGSAPTAASGSAPSSATATVSGGGGGGSGGGPLPAHIQAATGVSAAVLGFTPSPSFMSLASWYEHYRAWDHFLRVLGNPNELSDKENRLLAVQAICSAANVFVDASYAPIVKRKAGAGASQPPPAASSGASSGSGPAIARPASGASSSTGGSASSSHAAMVAAAKQAKLAAAAEKAAASGGGAAAAAPAAGGAAKDEKEDKDPDAGTGPLRKYLPQSNTLLHIFSPWLFEAVQCIPLDDAHAFAQAKSTAYKTLCGIFTLRSDQPFDKLYLSTFYQALNTDLHCGLKSIEWSLLQNCRNIFQCDLPGINILIPSFLVCIRRWLFSEPLPESGYTPTSPDKLTPPPVPVRKACTDILGAWICLPYHLGDTPLSDLHLNVPSVSGDRPTPAASSSDSKNGASGLGFVTKYKTIVSPVASTFGALRTELLTLHLRLLHNDPDGTIKMAALWAISVFISDELALPPPAVQSNALIRRCLISILAYTRHQSPALVAATQTGSVGVAVATPTPKPPEAYDERVSRASLELLQMLTMYIDEMLTVKWNPADSVMTADLHLKLAPHLHPKRTMLGSHLNSGMNMGGGANGGAGAGANGLAGGMNGGGMSEPGMTMTRVSMSDENDPEDYKKCTGCGACGAAQTPLFLAPSQMEARVKQAEKERDAATAAAVAAETKAAPKPAAGVTAKPVATNSALPTAAAVLAAKQKAALIASGGVGAENSTAVHVIIETLAISALSHIAAFSGADPSQSTPDQYESRARVASEMIYVMLEYLMAYPALLTAPPHTTGPSAGLGLPPAHEHARLRDRVFAVLQGGLSCVAIFGPANNSPNSPLGGSSSASASSVSAMSTASGSLAGGSKPGSGPSAGAQPAGVGDMGSYTALRHGTTAAGSGAGVSSTPLMYHEPIYSASQQRLVNALKLIEEAAGIAIRHLLNRLHHFPLAHGLGPEQIDSSIDEDNDRPLRLKAVHASLTPAALTARTKPKVFETPPGSPMATVPGTPDVTAVATVNAGNGVLAILPLPPTVKPLVKAGSATELLKRNGATTVTGTSSSPDRDDMDIWSESIRLLPGGYAAQQAAVMRWQEREATRDVKAAAKKEAARLERESAKWDEYEEEETEVRRFNLVYEHSFLLTVMERVHPDHRGSTARVIVRDMTGKYVWDYTPMHPLILTEASGSLTVASALARLNISAGGKAGSIRTPKQAGNQKSAPAAGDDDDSGIPPPPPPPPASDRPPSPTTSTTVANASSSNRPGTSGGTSGGGGTSSGPLPLGLSSTLEEEGENGYGMRRLRGDVGDFVDSDDDSDDDTSSNRENELSAGSTAGGAPPFGRAESAKKLTTVKEDKKSKALALAAADDKVPPPPPPLKEDKEPNEFAVGRVMDPKDAYKLCAVPNADDLPDSFIVDPTRDLFQQVINYVTDTFKTDDLLVPPERMRMYGLNRLSELEKIESEKGYALFEVPVPLHSNLPKQLLTDPHQTTSAYTHTQMMNDRARREAAAKNQAASGGGSGGSGGSGGASGGSGNSGPNTPGGGMNAGNTGTIGRPPSGTALSAMPHRHARQSSVVVSGGGSGGSLLAGSGGAGGSKPYGGGLGITTAPHAFAGVNVQGASNLTYPTSITSASFDPRNSPHTGAVNGIVVIDPNTGLLTANTSAASGGGTALAASGTAPPTANGAISASSKAVAGAGASAAGAGASPASTPGKRGGAGAGAAGSGILCLPERDRDYASPYDISRSLLSHLYLSHIYLSPLPYRSDSVTWLDDNGDRFRRSIKLLDAQPGRECHKIGIIYVALGQDDQRQILRNEHGSAAYHRFLTSLGWTVDVSRHRGFLAGLDGVGQSTGRYSVYYAASSYELMFHVVTCMPTKPNDPQQIHKKRQVGNDHVHIVWSDHTRDYRPSTISSQFNDVHIVIYPLANQLYRIAIHSKKSVVPPFGPLQDGMVVTGELLGPMVRATALNANRARRYSTAGYGRPYPTRKKYIDELVARHSARLPAHEFLSRVLPGLTYSAQPLITNPMHRLGDSSKPASTGGNTTATAGAASAASPKA